ncbi:MAG: beta-ketoacyl-[acyl-carrier-protein] synthase family protein [Bacteroidales bacterium]
MSTTVCGTGIISAIGESSSEAIRNLTESRSGLGLLSLFESRIKTYVGEVKLSNTELKEQLGLKRSDTFSRTALLGMAAASASVKEACIPQGARIGLISATTAGGMDLSEQFYREFKKNPNKGRLRDIIGHDCAQSTNQIADYCNITGFRTTISTACSSAANAILLGAEMVERGLLDYAVAGGTDALCRFTLNGFNSLMILGKEPCKPFDKNRGGMNLGEGAGYIVLTRKEHAGKRYCNLTGYANANDAFHQTASSTNGNGAYMAMKQALKMGGVQPGQIGYINAHGTGTQNNDLSEGQALIRLFGEKIPPFSSTKGYTGHTLAAAGGIEAVFSIMALTGKTVFCNLGFESPMEELNLFPLTAAARGIAIENVLSNSFGFGGNCTSLLFSKL